MFFKRQPPKLSKEATQKFRDTTKINTVWTKYRVEYGTTSGRQGAYIGDTVEELHNAIDSDKRLDNDVSFRDILKYGYFREFQDKSYETKDYVIDNCMHFMWTVR